MPYNCNINSVCPVIVITTEERHLETHRGKAGHADSRWVSLFTPVTAKKATSMKLRSSLGSFRNVSPLLKVALGKTLTISISRLNDGNDFLELVSAVSRKLYCNLIRRMVRTKSGYLSGGEGNLILPTITSFSYPQNSLV